MLMNRIRNHLVSAVNRSGCWVYSNDTLKITSQSRFLKVALNSNGKSRLRREVAGMNRLKTSRLHSLVPVFDLKTKFFGDVLEIEKLYPTQDEQKTLQIIYEALNSTAVKESLSLSVIPYLKQRITNQDALRLLQRCEGLLADVGMIHGDFHRCNVLCTDKNEPKVIDLDLFHESWDRKFDLINIFVSEAMLKGESWENAFMECWAKNSALSAIDKSWETLSLEDKKSAFYIYYLKRCLDEKTPIESESISEISKLLEWKKPQ